MAIINGSVVCWVLRVLRDTGHMRTAHMLEREIGLFFDTDYISAVVMSGDWNEAEDYLAGFIKPLDNYTSNLIYFDIRYIKFLEALERKDFELATQILVRDLQIFRSENRSRHEELVQLSLKARRRIHAQPNTKPRIDEDHVMVRRKALVKRLKWLLEINSLTRKKLVLSEVDKRVMERFVRLPRAMSPPKNMMTRPFPDAWSSSNVPFGACSTPMGLGNQYQAFTDKPPQKSYIHRRDPGQSSKSLDVPRNVAATLIIGTRPTSMGFHPHRPTLLLVGTCVGNIGLWDVTLGELLSFKIFSLRNPRDHSSESQIILGKNASEDADDDLQDGIFCELDYRYVAVNRVVWCPDGSLFGVAYSKNIVQLFTHSEGREIQKAFECKAHKGSVNDLAFATPCGQLSLITCGDDKNIKVWNVASGENTATFVFHESPVYFVCLDTRDGAPLLLSTSLDGKLVISYCTATSQGSGIRIFSCGTGCNGHSTLLEWEIKHGYASANIYEKFQPCQHYVVKFGMSDNLLAAGDDYKIKFWDINNHEKPLEVLTFDPDLPITPEICFNKDGELLAVEANGTSIKILASNKGIGLLSNLRASTKTRSLERQRKGRRNFASDSRSRRGINDLIEDSGNNYDCGDDQTSKGKAEKNGISTPDSKRVELS